jgi:hypothetical protein
MYGGCPAAFTGYILLGRKVQYGKGVRVLEKP